MIRTNSGVNSTNLTLGSMHILIHLFDTWQRVRTNSDLCLHYLDLYRFGKMVIRGSVHSSKLNLT